MLNGGNASHVGDGRTTKRSRGSSEVEQYPQPKAKSRYLSVSRLVLASDFLSYVVIA